MSVAASRCLRDGDTEAGRGGGGGGGRGQEEDSEQSIGSVYCVVYRLVSRSWEVEGDGWSAVHVYRDSADGSHRLVGWTVDDSAAASAACPAPPRLVLNVNLTADCSYRRKTDDFHKLTDEDGQHWGFGFYTKDESKREAAAFMRLVHACCRLTATHVTPTAAASAFSASLSPPPVPARSSSSDAAAVYPSPAASPYPALSSLGDGKLQQQHSHPPPLPSSARPAPARSAVAASSQLQPAQQQAQRSAAASPWQPPSQWPSPQLPGPPMPISTASSSSSSSAASPVPGPSRSSPTEASHSSLARASSIPLTSASSPPPHPPLSRPGSGKAASSSSSPPSRPRMGSSGDGSAPAPLYPLAASLSPAGVSKTRASPPPLITLGAALKQTSASISPSSAPPTLAAVSPTSSPSQSPQPQPSLGFDPSIAPTRGDSHSSASSWSVPGSARCASTPSPTQSPGAVSSPPPALPTRPSRKNSATVAPVLHRASSEMLELLYDQQIPMGSLVILPPKRCKASPSPSSSSPRARTAASGAAAASSSASPLEPASSSQAALSISDPHSVTHTVHVKYDPVTRRYVGLPAELASQLQQQFGLSPLLLDRVKLPQYASRIPSVLVQLRDHLVQHGGLEMEGIFRIAADSEETGRVKAALNEGRWLGTRDIHVCAQLIKVWWREMPAPRLLDDVEAAAIAGVDSEEAAGAVVQQRVQEPQLSLLLWLLDLCCLVCSRQAVNKMGSKALGIVISPNLFTPTQDDPMAALLYSQKVALFLQKAIEWRARQQPPQQQQQQQPDAHAE